MLAKIDEMKNPKDSPKIVPIETVDEVRTSFVC